MMSYVLRFQVCVGGGRGCRVCVWGGMSGVCVGAGVQGYMCVCVLARSHRGISFWKFEIQQKPTKDPSL